MKITYYPRYFIRRFSVKGKDTFYSAGYKCLYPECTRHGMTPWQHYVIDGKRKGHDDGNHPSDTFFFQEGYEFEYPDIKDSVTDAWHHYAETGFAEGRDNGLHPKESMFFAEGYLWMYPDVTESGMDPWHHYVLTGRKEGRDNGLHPKENEFFAEGYAAMYHDIADAGIDPWRHYVLAGEKEGRDNGLHPNDDIFFAEGYLEMYPDVAETGIDPWHHYVLAGKKEGRDNGLHPDKDVFSSEGYLLNYSNVMKAGENPWLHYMLHGRTECQKSWLEDYSIRLAGHEQEIVRSVYLTPSSANRKKQESHLRVLLIGHEFSVSGAPLALLGIAKILIADGYKVDFAVKDVNQIRDISLYDGLGADVFLIPNSADCFPGADQVLQNYDLVIINTIVMGSYAALCQNLNIPHIWLVHESLPLIRYFFRMIGGCEQRFRADFQNIVFVSRYVSDSVESAFGIKCRYLNNSVNDISFSADDAENQENIESFGKKVRTFAVVGGVEQNKAQDCAIASFMYLAACPRYKDRWKLFMVGRHGEDSLDRSMGIRLDSVTKNQPDISWCGVVTEKKWELFRSIDFFIVPSFGESSSLVAIEAAMLGKPVICTTHVGAKYLTENNAGFLFEPGDSAGLRDLIEKCLDMPEDEYRSMSRRARLNYEKTSSPAVYHKALSALISETLERFSAGPALSDSSENSAVSLRTMSTGKNAFPVEVPGAARFEYVSFADFAGTCDSGQCGSMPENSSKTGVVVPVTGGAGSLKVLVRSLFANTDLPHMFIFVDDCSDTDTADFLKDAVSGRDDCILVRNEEKLGLVRSANIGAEKALESCCSFVLLCQNAEVPSGWLGSLMRPLLEDETVSSAIPFSDSCGVFSFPFSDSRERNDAFLAEFGLAGINRAMRESRCGDLIDVPAAHGFCMAFSGKVWRSIGGLNDALFESLTGAQKEWSLRAGLDGYISILTSELYVACHEGIASSHEDANGNRASVQDILSVMFPSYESGVSDFARECPLSGLMVTAYLSLARQKGYKAEVFTESDPFKAKMSGGDGIFVLKAKSITKLAVRLLGETILVGNARNLESTGIFDA